jgi:hypothetical protein
MYVIRLSAPCFLASPLASAQNALGSSPIFGRKVYSCIGFGESVPSKS